MRDSLKIIQTLSKILRIVCVVAYILCTILAAVCILGIVFAKNLYVEIQNSVATNFISQYFFSHFHVNRYGELVVTLSIGVIMCFAQSIFFSYAATVFRLELNTGHPFTTKVAKGVFYLGLLKILIPLSATILAFLFETVMSKVLGQEYHFYYGHMHYIFSGIFIIIVSLFCSYGAEKIFSIKNAESDENCSHIDDCPIKKEFHLNDK